MTATKKILCCLPESERLLIRDALDRPPRCQARSYAELLLTGQVPAEEMLDVDVFLKQLQLHRRDSFICQEIWHLQKVYEAHLNHRTNAWRRRYDPTIQERDRRSGGEDIVVKKWYHKIKRAAQWAVDWVDAARVLLRRW